MGHVRVPFNPCANHTFTPSSRKVEDVDAMLYYDGSLLVKECCIKSAAAPTYLPSHKGQVDGGMFANVSLASLLWLTSRLHQIHSFNLPSTVPNIGLHNATALRPACT